MPRKRSAKRDNFIGAYVTDDLKAKIMEDAKRHGMNASDWFRFLLANAGKVEKETKREK